MRAKAREGQKTKEKQIPPLRRASTALLWEDKDARGFGRDDRL